MIVIDACIVVKWFIEENYTAKAVHIHKKLLEGKLNVIIPDLLFYEVINVLKMKAMTEPGDVISAIQILFESDLRVIPMNREQMELAVHISDKYKISIYDAVYLSLAKDFNCQLITADEKLIDKVKTPVIKHIKDYV